VLPLGKAFQDSTVFAGKAGAHPGEGAPLLGRLLVFPTNNRLDWKGLPGTNTLAYYEHS